MTMSLEVAMGNSAKDIIKAKTRNEIESYLAVNGKSNIYDSARSLSSNISDDYGNRFLVELIQNAHDAHPADRNDGEIVLRFDPNEGEYGCLYAANRGNGFTEENFRAISNIAMSSKPVNEGIG